MASLNPFKRSRRRAEEPASVVISPEDKAAAEVAAIQAQIAAATRDEATAVHETDAQAKARELRLRIEAAAQKRIRLERELFAARERQQFGRLKFHHEEISADAFRLMSALRAAAKLNTSVVNALQRARVALGDEFAMKYLKPVVYNGLVREDLIESWGNDIVRQLSSIDRQFANVTPQNPPAPRLPAPVAAKLSTSPKTDMDSSPPAQAFPAAEVSQVAEAALEEGQVRVKVRLDGWPPADDLPACRLGDRVVLPRKHAEYVAMRGIVEIIEVFAAPAAASAGKSNAGDAK